MKLQGRSIIAGNVGGTGAVFQAINATTLIPIRPFFHCATEKDVELAAHHALKACPVLIKLSGTERANFLHRCADELYAFGSVIIERANLETALTHIILQEELRRTIAQLRLFADHIDEGSWVNARIDTALSARCPFPRSDIRSVLRPIGPVAVFSSNSFPLACSVAGSDTASALAAGCPIIVKAHPDHPGTSEIVGHAIQQAVRACGLPDGTFSLLFDQGFELARSLIKHPDIQAVAFTGSEVNRRALIDMAASRHQPIPVFAGMSSLNPIVILPGAIHGRLREIAIDLCASLTSRVGQSTTKPGLIFVPKDQALGFAEILSELVDNTDMHPMLSAATAVKFAIAVQRCQKLGYRRFGQSGAAIFYSDIEGVIREPQLMEEIFGPTTLIVAYTSIEQLLKVAATLQGQLTFTVHGDKEEIARSGDWLQAFTKKTGRLVINGFPDHIEICDAMVHGGPYPATSDARATSIGTQAILRFVRPMCYQDCPQVLLPEELLDANPRNIMRTINGNLTREPVRTASSLF